MTCQYQKNVYTCRECGHHFVTVDRDDGTTPFMTKCQVLECQGGAQSSFYRVDQSLTPQFEWYRPDAAEITYMLNSNAREHVSKNGLLLRPVKKEAT